MGLRPPLRPAFFLKPDSLRAPFSRWCGGGNGAPLAGLSGGVNESSCEGKGPVVIALQHDI